MKKQHLIFIHLLYWILNIFNQFRYEILSEKPAQFFSIDYLLGYSFVFVSIITFYFNYFFVLPKIFRKRKFLYFIGGIFLNFLVFILLRYSVEEILYPAVLGFRNYQEGTSFSFYFIDNLYYGSTAVFMSSVIWFLNYSIKTDKENRILQKEKSEAQNSLLKSQINPHFIFNTLNNIYSLVNMKSEKSLTAIEKLGDLLRFSSNEITKDFTTLGNEIQYVKSYLDLESLRIQNPENIYFSDETKNKNLKIAPMILIPFVENAFKHGDLKNDILEISVKTEGNNLYFYQRNKISRKQKDQSSGIGIENVRKRLNILYPQKHQLNIDKNDDYFTINLNMEL